MNQKHMKHLSGFCIIIVVLFVLIFLGGMTVNFHTSSKYDKINHFDDINVCNRFDAYIIEEEIVDEYIGDITFINSYVHKLDYEGKKFTLYAYEFDNVASAQNYYVRARGTTVDGNIDYHASSGMFTSNLIVRYNNSLYRIEAGGLQEYTEILKFLNSIFKISIRK